jgi:two-component sensor histidine kinase
LTKTEGRRIAAPTIALALAATLVVAIAGLSVLFVWQSYHSTLAAARSHAQSSAHIIAAHLEWMLEASNQTLQRIDAALGPDPTRRAPGRVSDINVAVGDLPEGFQYSVYDVAGKLRYSSLSTSAEIDVSDREYFQAARSGRTPFVSTMLKERLTGDQVFVIARRISRDGVFAGVTTMAIRTARMGEFWGSIDLSPNSSVAVVRSDGWLVGRYPQIPETIDLSGTPLVEAMKTSSEGVAEIRDSPVDHLARIVGYTPIPGWPLTAAAGIDRKAALAPFLDNLRIGLLVALPVALLLAAGLVWIVRLLRLDRQRRDTVERTLEDNRAMLREVHHRVKNNLQTVMSLIRLGKLPPEARDSLYGRLAAMVAVHEHIYSSDQFGDVEIAPYLNRLLAEIKAGYDKKVDVLVDIDPLKLSRDQVQPLGLLVNEVVSNAFKHAFPSGKGVLSVSLKGTEEGARLIIADDGAGFDPSTSPVNMGTKLVAAFTGQLGGRHTLDSSQGTRFVADFPLRTG